MTEGAYGFEHLVYEMPWRHVDVEVLAREAGFGNELVERLHAGGLQQVPISDNLLPQLVNRAIDTLSRKVPDLGQRTHGIVFAHSSPLLAPTNVPFLALCVEGQNLQAVPRIAVSGQPCAILHMAVQLAGAWIEEANDNDGILVIGADQAYCAKERIFFGSAMGDVAVAGLLTRTARENRVLASVSECEVIACSGECSPIEKIARFRELNPLYIRHTIETCLHAANLTLTELKFIIPHTPYTMIWDVIAKLLSFPRGKIMTEYLHDTGHLNSNDSFVHYIRAVNEGRIEDGDLVLLINPGFGGTRGCTLIRR